MIEGISWLVTIMYGQRLLRCALKIPCTSVSDRCLECPMDLSSRKEIHAHLPPRVRECGPIVEVERLFDIHIANAMNHQQEEV